MSSPIKLEIGCGQRPTDGYSHNDVNDFDGVDYICPAWKVGLPDGSLDEVIALGVIEHMTYEHVDNTFRNVHRMLKPGGLFLFDVPNIYVWCHYMVMDEAPFSKEHVMSTLYGWQRWDGDEHRSGWTDSLVRSHLGTAGFLNVDIRSTADEFLNRGFDRNRFHRPTDAHFYVVATK